MKRILVLAAMAALLSLYGCGQDTLTKPSSIELMELADDMGEIKETHRRGDQTPPDDTRGGIDRGEHGGTVRGDRPWERVGQADEMGQIKETGKRGDQAPPDDTRDNDPFDNEGRLRNGGGAKEDVQDKN